MSTVELTKQYNAILARQRKGKQYKFDQLNEHNAGRIDRNEFNRRMDIAHTLMRKLEAERRYLRNTLIERGAM